MGLSVHVYDRDSKAALSGVFVVETYGSVYEYEFTEGSADIPLNGAPWGRSVNLEVWVDGYVPHFESLIQFNGWTIDVPLSRYAGYEEESPEAEPEVLSVTPLLVLAAVGYAVLR